MTGIPGGTRTAAFGGFAAASAVVVLTACGPSPAPTAPAAAAGGPGASSLSGSLTVFAAASLQESFTTLKKGFEKAHPGASIVVNFGASSALAQQITQGSPADVFASASQATMDQVVQAGAASSSRPFASNVMQIVVPAANPAGITSLADLGKPGVKLAVCQPQVPCGSVATKVFANAKMALTPVSQEADVKSVLTKVGLGEVDAGVVYVTDVKAAGAKVKGIDIPANLNASTSYPIATLSKAANPALADAFTAYVLSPEGTTVLKAGGFAAP